MEAENRQSGWESLGRKPPGDPRIAGLRRESFAVITVMITLPAER